MSKSYSVDIRVIDDTDSCELKQCEGGFDNVAIFTSKKKALDFADRLFHHGRAKRYGKKQAAKMEDEYVNSVKMESARLKEYINSVKKDSARLKQL